MWTILASITDKLLSLFADWLRKRDQEVAQNERDLLEDSPGDWFNNHFDGMSGSKPEDTTPN
jgi:hypothetical protein